MLPVKAVRDAVVQTLMTWHDKFVAVSYVSEEWGVMPESVTLSYLPDGFTLTEVSEPKDVGTTMPRMIIRRPERSLP